MSAALSIHSKQMRDEEREREEREITEGTRPLIRLYVRDKST